MADFISAHRQAMGNEGGYANNPADRGGETYKGISRKNWPAWSGWRHIDACLRQMVKQPPYGTPEYFNWARWANRQLSALPTLQRQVEDFYLTHFWKRLGEIDNQELAAWVYDKDINTGDDGTRWLQAAAHVKVDGQIGSVTLAAVNAADPFVLLERMKSMAVDHYLTEAQKPHQKGFWKSWIARVGLSPEKLAQANYEARNFGIIA